MLDELVRALLRRDARVARQIVADAVEAGVVWSALSRPSACTAEELQVAASIVELLAARAQVPAPEWTRSVGPSPVPIWLVSVEHRPRLRQRLLTESPEPLRARLVFAPEDFLSAA